MCYTGINNNTGNIEPIYVGTEKTNWELSINKLGEVFLNDEKFDKINLYKPVGVEIVDNPKILQGYIELSNITLQNEMTDLILVQRAFQFNSRGIKAVDEMWGMVNNLQGR